jgi:hypothetical protein
MEAKRIERIERIAGLYVDGATLVDIARQVNATVEEVRRDLRKLQDAWLSDKSCKLDHGGRCELARLDAEEIDCGEQNPAEAAECARRRCVTLGVLINSNPSRGEPRPRWIPRAVAGHWSADRAKLAAAYAATLSLAAN